MEIKCILRDGSVLDTARPVLSWRFLDGIFILYDDASGTGCSLAAVPADVVQAVVMAETTD